ncbi:hypothetical protein [Bythopirellula goksoeyrii]|uniref:Uncharacterized protein n=1 Tax=Bythopirellula goksoeyrii TaxID=1400387 RepID=A0A5B9QDZ2_9BACT|nr:hypothetical protein [Bythopirellula goksoeyrii]QEG35850.1 hypothetical protein Pr1d_31560 [Bythopirellula goksoeyrii]
MSKPYEHYPIDRDTIASLYSAVGKNTSRRKLVRILGTISESAFGFIENGRSGPNPHPPYHATVGNCRKIIDGSENVLGKGNKLTLDKLIDQQRPTTALSNNPQDYLNLKFGRFISYNRQDSGPKDHTWFAEQVKLWQIVAPPYAPPGSLHFTGWANNNAGQSDGPYQLYAVRVSPFLFTMLGFDEKLSHGCFQSIFTKKFAIRNSNEEVVNVLSGCWVGVDHACHSAVFRGLVSSEPITNSMVDQIQFNYTVQPFQTSTKYKTTKHDPLPKKPPSTNLMNAPHFKVNRQQTTPDKSK